MELRQLEYLREICRRGSVTAAAAELHVAQPSVTASIKRLEAELGVILFNRANRRMELTTVGKEFLRDAESILAQVEDSRRKMLDYELKPKGVVRLGITPMMSVTLLPPVLARYQRAYPEVELQVVEEGSLSIAARLERGELDLGILVTQSISPKLESRVIRRGEVFACLPPGHQLVGRERIPLRLLKNSPFILFKEDTYSRQLILRECSRAGFDPRVVFVSSQIGTVAGLVQEGMGIAFFFEDLARSLDSLEIRPLEPRLDLEVGVVWPRHRYVSLAARTLVEALADEVPTPGLSADGREKS